MKTRDPIRVLVIDDSAFSRQAITRMLRSSPLVEVVGEASDGEEALRKTFELEPDLITLDLEMPKMDGFTFLRIVMSKRPTPILVISGDQDGVWKALELGAVDIIAKPTPYATPRIASIAQELIRKVHSIRELRLDRVQDGIRAAAERNARQGLVGSARAVVIGASTGGPSALIRIFEALPIAPPCAFLVAQHMPSGFTRGFADRLDRCTPLRAVEARGGEEPQPGLVLVAPGGMHLELECLGGRTVTRLLPGAESDRYVPSVDRLFASAAKSYGPDLLGVVLTGMGNDGRHGVEAIKESGGSVIAESQETAVVFGMPQQAIRTGAVDHVLPLTSIAESIRAGVGDARP